MGIVIDLILLAIIAAIVIYYSKKGLVAASKNIVSLILTIVLMVSLQDVMLVKLQESSFGKNIESKISAKVAKAYDDEDLPLEGDDSSDDAKEICKKLSLPTFLSGSIEDKLDDMNEAKNNILNAIAAAITKLILRVVALILLFILARVAVFLILKLFELPGLKTLNTSLGAVMGLLNALIFIYIACGVVNLIIPADKLGSLGEMINSTWILKTMYNHNLLFKLIM